MSDLGNKHDEESIGVKEVGQLTNESTEQKTTTQGKNIRKANANKNPDGYTPYHVLSMIKSGNFVPGSPPQGKSCPSLAWKNGIHFLFTKETENNPKREVTNWFYCSKCDWIYNGWLTKGTGAIGQHYKKHLIDPPYVFKRQELAKLLAKATDYGNLNGSIDESRFAEILPKADKWSVIPFPYSEEIVINY